MFGCTNTNVCRTGRCDANLSGQTPFAQYQRQKIIQNTVRVPSSIYTMNLGALAVYQRPLKINARVNWNQMSDRAVPHVQQANASGATYHTSSTKHTITRLRPGALSPGGEGVDIKHNSYNRYLAKIKGAGPVRQQAVPKDYDLSSSIPFNPAYPIYGGKVMKTGIVAGCNCGPDAALYVDGLPTEVNNAIYTIPYCEEVNACLCPPILDRPVSQYYGYSQSNSFLLQCAFAAKAGEIINIL